MRVLRLAGCFAAAWVILTGPGSGRAAADVLVVIDKASQQMAVAVNGRTRYVWPVSTGRSGYGTPSGRFRPQWMARTYFSKKYYDSPMPHSIFFHHGYAIHGTDYIHRLGGPASHGCVRLHPRAAATLFALVQAHGMSNTLIIIGDSIALERPERWGALEHSEEQFIELMTDRLMLAEQIERKEALEKMAQMRAADALKRMLERGRDGAAPPDEEPAVAIGVQANERAAIPVPVTRSLPSAKLKATARTQPTARLNGATPIPRPRMVDTADGAKPAPKRQAVEPKPERRVEPKPEKRRAAALSR